MAEGEDGIEGIGVGEDHEEAIDSKGDAAGRGHEGQGREESFIEGIRRSAALLAEDIGFFEAGALLGGVGEFRVGIGEFNTAEIEFPAFGAGGIAGFAAGEGGEGGGVVDQHDGMVGGKGRFDTRDEIEVESVGFERGGGVPAGVLDEGLRDRDHFP